MKRERCVRQHHCARREAHLSTRSLRGDCVEAGLVELRQRLPHGITGSELRELLIHAWRRHRGLHMPHHLTRDLAAPLAPHRLPSRFLDLG
eukprot:7384524-Prymnesium_polylepis.2